MTSALPAEAAIKLTLTLMPRGESPEMMANAVLLLATLPLDQMAGRVGYAQQLLQEFGWIKDGRGPGLEPEARVSGYSLI